MVISTNQKPRPMSAVDPTLEQDSMRQAPPDIRVRNSVQNKGGNTFAYVILALVLLFGGYMLYNYNSTGTSINTVSDKTEVAPSTAAPVPPAATDVSPKADAPAATGATNPPAATGTSDPAQPAAPSSTPTPPATTTP
jgi:zona occludens toxin (predicted ATPase)